MAEQNKNFTVIHKKSNVVVDGSPKLPTAEDLKYGEIAINYSKGYETLSIKNDENEIVTFKNTVPDWNAEEGEEGYIKNRPFYKSNKYKDVEVIVNITLGEYAGSYNLDAEGNKYYVFTPILFNKGVKANTKYRVEIGDKSVIVDCCSSLSLTDGSNCNMGGWGPLPDKESTFYIGGGPSVPPYPYSGNSIMYTSFDCSGEQLVITELFYGIKKIDSEFLSIVQTSGSSTTDIMSQDAVTKIISNNISANVVTAVTVNNTSYTPKNGKVNIGNFPISAGTGTNSAILGKSNEASGNYSVAEGSGTTASGSCSHAEGRGVVVDGMYSHGEGYLTSASTSSNGAGAHAEGWSTLASGNGTHAEGISTSASTSSNGAGAHAEGWSTLASGWASHAEGSATTASNRCSHAEGWGVEASGQYSHAEGGLTTASGNYGSHAEGYGSGARGSSSHAEGNGTSARGAYSHTEGHSTHTENMAEHASGQYNNSISGSTEFGDSGNTLFTVGNGSLEPVNYTVQYHNAFEIRQNGDIYIADTNAEGVFYKKPMIKLQDALANGSDGVDVDIVQTTGTSETSVMSQKAVTDSLVKIWKGNYNQYEALGEYDDNTIYVIL